MAWITLIKAERSAADLEKLIKTQWTALPLSALTSFFFTRRRRQTRFKCDWSSDVCSSDLECVEARRSTEAEGRCDLGGRSVLRLRCFGELRRTRAPWRFRKPGRLRDGRHQRRLRFDALRLRCREAVVEHGWRDRGNGRRLCGQRCRQRRERLVDRL